MKDNHGYSGTQLMVAFAGGAAVGAAIALLVAPRSGRETRELIADRARSGKEKAKRLPSAVKSAGGAAREAFSEAVREH
jgi:gas vesicle protein